ncbi:MAG: hypothetical protein D6692_05085 [Planctomycetota bacterium]|nr:MAG: hypothetical protein D6692_05085 [Planctomycetota bacterium]
MLRSATPSCRAFTLLELGLVVLVAGILAATVVPSVARVREARAAAGAYEIARALEFARASAAASGLPCGARFDLDVDRLEFVMVSSNGLEGLPGALGEPEPGIDLRAGFGVDLVRMNFTVGPLMSSSDLSTIWFDHTGKPHLRTQSGELVGLLTSDGEIELAAGQTIQVRAFSGLVEVEP